jgi:hypothetical protein
MADSENTNYCHHTTLQIPAQVSCLSLGEPHQLFVGSGMVTLSAVVPIL